MENYIENLYYGNIEAQESKTHITPKLKIKLNELTQKEEKLSAALTDEARKLFADYVDAYNEFSCLSCADSFITGFRLGARFAYDTFAD